MTDRGQAQTLEAIAAGLLLLSSLVFALQATAVTPLTGSTSNQHIENQQRQVAEGLLTAEATNGTLSRSIRYYNRSTDAFYGAPPDGYPMGGPPTAFGHALNETFVEQGIAVNVNLYYIHSNGDRIPPREMVNLGNPSSNAAIASRTVTLYDDDPLLAPNGTATNHTVSGGEYFVDHDVAAGSELYNVVRVEVVVWRM